MKRLSTFLMALMLTWIGASAADEQVDETIPTYILTDISLLPSLL